MFGFTQFFKDLKLFVTFENIPALYTHLL